MMCLAGGSIEADEPSLFQDSVEDTAATSSSRNTFPHSFKGLLVVEIMGRLRKCRGWQRAKLCGLRGFYPGWTFSSRRGGRSSDWSAGNSRHVFHNVERLGAKIRQGGMTLDLGGERPGQEIV